MTFKNEVSCLSVVCCRCVGVLTVLEMGEKYSLCSDDCKTTVKSELCVILVILTVQNYSRNITLKGFGHNITEKVIFIFL